MTKKEMLIAMKPNGNIDLSNRLRNSKDRIEQVYKWFLNSKQDETAKRFCFNVLTVW